MIRMMSNLDSIGAYVGALSGMSRGLSGKTYMHKVIRDSHKSATKAFDKAAAATAAAGRLDHVFEFGVPGITDGDPKFTDPTSQAARLWIHKISGKGNNQDIFFVFRPAKNRVPKPTPENTGVKQEFLDKLSKKKYVFWNKAAVMESGATVQNKSQQDHGYLFLPTMSNFGLRDPKQRGFVLWNTHRKGNPPPVRPGRSSRGTFTSFWETWWESQGEEIMNQKGAQFASEDIMIASKGAQKAARRYNFLRSPSNTNPKAVGRKESSKALREFGKKRNDS